MCCLVYRAYNFTHECKIVLSVVWFGDPQASCVVGISNSACSVRTYIRLEIVCCLTYLWLTELLVTHILLSNY